MREIVKRLFGSLARGRPFGLLLLSILLAIRVSDPFPVEIARVRLFDFYQRVLPRATPDSPVVIIDIDERSMADHGQWPWPRTLLAQLLAKLANSGAVVTGFDIVFPEPDRMSLGLLADYLTGLDSGTRARLKASPSNDVVFANIVRQARVVLGRGVVGGAQPEETSELAVPNPALAIIGDDPQPFLPIYLRLVRNLPLLEDAAAGHGIFTLEPELDGIVRRIPTFFRVGETLLPALSLELLRVASGETTLIVRTNEAGLDSVSLAGVRVPTDGSGRMWIHYANRDFQRIVSATDVIAGTVGPEQLRGKITLVGTSAVGLRDIKTSPIHGAIPGVEIHAQVIDAILTGSILTRPNYALGAELVVAAFASLIIIALVPMLGALFTLVSGGLVIGVLVGGSWYLFVSKGILLDTTYPAFASFSLYAALSFLNYAREENARRSIRTAFGQYLAPTLVEQLATNPKRLTLGGETREMSILFSDIRGFTSISERYKSDPQSLTALITRVLTPLTEVILQHRGTIDKYMGDCVMAFWNAPLDDPEHAMHACEAALEMIKALELLNVLGASGKTELDQEETLRVGIGINTGLCVVGNIGTPKRFDYSVLGDSVNLASRLEGQCKTYGVDAIIGEETALQVQDQIALLELDLVTVHGKQEAVRIFALVGDATKREAKEFLDLQQLHSRMVEAYRGCSWDEAEALISTLADLPGASSSLYELYKARIAYFRQNPPPNDWNGVFAATTK